MRVWKITKFFAMIIVFNLILISFIGMNIGDTNEPRSRAGQPYNSFKEFFWGGVGQGEDSMFGWNITYIENLNNDQYPDLVIGAPWQDIGSDTDAGAVYIFFGQSSTGFNDLNYSNADVKIGGEGVSNKFGWDVADAGDVNNDGINDLIVGAPGIRNGQGRAYIFYGSASGTIPTNAGNADRILDGQLIGIPINGFYGSSVSGAGDVNNDGYDDLIVGAPGSDQAVISYGYKNRLQFLPDIWDDDPNTPDVIQFSKGCNNTPDDNNTWGINGENDGWDWIDSIADGSGLYGGGESWDIAFHYGPWEPDGPDGDNLTWNNQTALEVCIGRTHTTDNPRRDNGASAAWGIEFDISSEMVGYLQSNGTLKVGFDYTLTDTERIFGSANAATEEACTIRSRIWNRTGQHYLGPGGWIAYQTSWNNNVWQAISDTFDWEISEYVDTPGSYYWDFGSYFGDGQMGDNEGLMAVFDNVKMELTNERHIVIQGAKSSGFGATVLGIGDLDDDNYFDVMVGAPSLDGGHVALFYGKKRFKPFLSESVASLFLNGKMPGDKFGHSISLAGDVDNDNLQDIIIGAPGGDYANLYYGDTLKDGPLVPNLWENDAEKGTPILEFNTGVKTTGNSEGITGNDDGWDSWDGAYGFESGETAGSSTRYNDAEQITSANIESDGELIIGIGRNYGNDARPDSGAYGVEFTVTPEMKTALDKGGNVVISYDWLFDNNRGLDPGDDIWIRTYLRNSSEFLDFGWDLDNSDVNEVFYLSAPVDSNDFFIQSNSDFITKSGSYYVDIGGKVRRWDGGWQSRENGIFHFDNFGFYIAPPPDKKFIGTAGSGFGTSVGYVDKLNIDNYGDIIVGAPYYNSPNGNDSGAIFGFFTDIASSKLVYAENAEYIHYGETQGDNFGWVITGKVSLDNDDYGEIAVGAVNYDFTVSNIGRVYLLSVKNGPRVRLLHPLGGEILKGEILINATVTDPDENVKDDIGVEFSYSKNLADWEVIGNDPTPGVDGHYYEHNWNTTTLTDGDKYYVKAWVQDEDLHKGVFISQPVTIDNPHKPSISFQTPLPDSTIKGVLELTALAKDSELDLIGGGIDYSHGVGFYLSNDSVKWELLGIDHTKKWKETPPDIYKSQLNTKGYPDGEYWLRVNATDWDGFEVVETIKVTIDNPSRPPSLNLISPIDGQELVEKVNIRTTSFDFDGDINSSGITFIIASYLEPNNWQLLGNTPKYFINSTGAHIYTFEWDTTAQSDGWYQLKCLVNDSTGLENETDGIEVKIHNKENNPPFIQLISPKGGDILDIAEPLSARVRDLEDNIDANGVTFYYSKDKVKWGFIGTAVNPLESDKEYFKFLWSTDTVPDGEYWLNASVTDSTRLTSWYVMDEPIIIHNKITNPPIARFITPVAGQFINGSFKIQVYAYDLEDKVENIEVALSYTTDLKFEDWINLGTLTTPKKGENTFEFTWDTNNFDDGKYWLKAVAIDLNEMEGEAISDYFYIHNSIDNPPLVEFLGPHSGEVKGTIKLNATVFDLENNLDENGVYFEYSTDNKTWTLMGNDPLGRLEGMDIIFDLIWDTTQVSDNIYWFRARARDDTGQEGIDVSRGQIIIHNNQNNPPILTLIEPTKGYDLKDRQLIQVKVLDFEDDVKTVSFDYSTDNSSWTPIDSNININKVGIYYYYSTMWDAEDLNGEFYINIRAVDEGGRKAQISEGPFKKGEVGGKGGTDKETQDFTVWIILIIIVIIMVMVILLLMRRSKKREEEIIEEVAAEAQRSQVLEGEIISTPSMIPPPSTPMAGPAETPEGLQTYIPPESLAPQPQADLPQLPAYEVDVETIESYMQEMNVWKTEGYNVSRLEQIAATDEDMFARVFPIFSSNVSKLKNISSRLNSMDTTGYDVEVDSINQKLFEPDQASAVEQEFKNLENKMTPSFQEPGTPPTPETSAGIDDILPELLPSDSEAPPPGPVPMEGVEPGQVQEAIPPQVQPEQYTPPPDVELPPTEIPPEVALPESEAPAAPTPTPPEEEGSITETKKDAPGEKDTDEQ